LGTVLSVLIRVGVVQDLCGNRTEYCQSCRKYIRLREWIGHELQFHTILNAASELSR
jgi:hypothetical protein